MEFVIAGKATYIELTVTSGTSFPHVNAILFRHSSGSKERKNDNQTDRICENRFKGDFEMIYYLLVQLFYLKKQFTLILLKS